MENLTRKQALDFMICHPAALLRACGFTLMRDDLHGEWMKEMLLGDSDMTILGHRGSFKTVAVSGALAIGMAVFANKNTIFFRKGEADVVEVIRQTRGIIENKSFQQIVLAATGNPIQVLRANATSITTNHFVSPRGGDQLLGIGIGGSITGKHADLIFTDDIVNTSDRSSHAEREKTKTVYMELQNIRNRGGRIINTGTPWHKEDAISLMPNIKRFDCYSTGLIAPEKLEELRKSMSPSLFAANYELRHIAAENALFDTPSTFTPEAEKLRDGIAHVDAAYGGEDYTALTCAKRDGDTLYLYGRLWRKHVDTLMDALQSETERLMCAPIYCETNGDKGYLARELRRRNMAVRAYPEKMNKYLKISTYLKKWWGNIVFLEGTDRDYIAQIMDYTEDAEHDDAPDSAACCCRILDRNGASLYVGG